jgi:uncharacterized protein
MSLSRKWRLRALVIDFHVHIGALRRARDYEYYDLTARQLIDRMDREGIERSVLLPLESPEAMPGYFLTEEAIAARDIYPERLIAFLSLDPRSKHMARLFDMFVQDYDCKGFGELNNSLAFDDERNQAIYAKCDQYSLPLVFHNQVDVCYHASGLSALEQMLPAYPNVAFCGHGPGFWAAISCDSHRTVRYPEGSVVPGGALDRLMSEYENLYGIFDAGSGYNAMTREPDFIIGFIERHHTRLLFGTDYMQAGQQFPQVDWLANLDIPSQWRDDMATGNAQRLLQLTPDQ